MQNPRMTVLVGLPASGKSTWTQTHKSKNEVVISSDAIRAEVFGDVNDQTHNAEVFDLMMKRTCDALKARIDVIYDATNLNSKRRANLIREVEQRCKGITVYFRCVIFATDWKKCVKRNEARERTVPYEVMKRMLCSFQPPWWSEGWDEIHFAEERECTPAKARAAVLSLRSLAHDNPHHEFTVGDHCIAAFDYALEHNFPLDVCTAAFFHDCGKAETKSFHDCRGNTTSDAHFYGHQYVSAYKVLCLRYSDNNDFWLYVSLLISLHMCWYMDEKGRETTINRFEIPNRFEMPNNWLRRDLSWLHDADMAAH